jgi:riboflavin synthase
VDGTAVVAGIQRGSREQMWSFRSEPEVRAYLIPKGSIAIDGVSLTIARVEGDTFEVALIPTTLERTTLGQRREGDRVNIETDIVARTLVTALKRMTETEGTPSSALTVDMLREQGWGP